METVFKALRVELSDNLMPLSEVLFSKGIPHRVFEEGGSQVLVVSKSSDVQLVKEFYSAWKLGALNSSKDFQIGKKMLTFGDLNSFHIKKPLCLSLISLSCIGFFITYWLASYKLVSLFTFLPFTFEGGRINFGTSSGEYWRAITPVFLHFGWLHLVFNCLWLWEIGGKIERTFGGLHLLVLFLLIAMVSNFAQSFWSGPSLFGGMSGVVYGLLGFCWMESKLNPTSALRLQSGVLWFMLGWLVVCMIGLVEAIGFGAIANSAHVGGLISGILLGLASGILKVKI